VHLFNVPLANIEEDLFFHGLRNNFGAGGAARLIWRDATEKDIAYTKFTASSPIGSVG
jgi:hypothetical protein